MRSKRAVEMSTDVTVVELVVRVRHACRSVLHEERQGDVPSLAGEAARSRWRARCSVTWRRSSRPERAARVPRQVRGTGVVPRRGQSGGRTGPADVQVGGRRRTLACIGMAERCKPLRPFRAAEHPPPIIHPLNPSMFQDEGITV